MDSVNSSSSASISASVSVLNEQRRASLQPTLINATMANATTANANTILNAFDNMDVDQSFASTQIPTPLATSHKSREEFFRRSMMLLKYLEIKQLDKLNFKT